MLDRVPLGGAGRIVTHGHFQTEQVGQPFLQLRLPQAGAPAVAAAPIAQDEEPVGADESALAGVYTGSVRMLASAQHALSPCVIRRTASPEHPASASFA